MGLLKPTKEDVILDVGAGTGVIASQVSKQCDEVFALEPNVERVNYIKRKFPEVKAFDGVAENIQFPESYFTKVYSVSAFHHFSDQDKAISEFERILKPGGLLLIHEFPPKSSVARLEKRHYGSHFQTPEGLQEKVQRVGFQKMQQEKTKQGYFILFQKS